MSVTTSGIDTISLICLPVTDQDKAIDFYVETLGFEKRTDTAFGNGYRWVEVYPPNGNTGIALAPPPEGRPVEPTNTGVTLTTDDIDATHAHLSAAGADVDAEIARMGGPVPPMFWFRDTEGHTLLIVETPKA